MSQVTVYSLPNCTPCKVTKLALEKRGITYREVDLSANAAEAEKLRADYGYAQAPVVVVSDGTQEQHWSGFRPDKLAAIPTPKM